MTSLTGKTADGAAWNTAVLAISRVLGVLSQIVVAYFLGSYELGLVALAQSISTFGGTIHTAGLREVLLPRKSLKPWENDAIWMSLSLSAVALLIVLVAGIVSAPVLPSNQVLKLLAIFSLQFPIRALGLVPSIRLQREIRFQRLALIALVCRISHVSLTILLVVAGFGAIGMTAAFPITELIRTWMLSRDQRLLPWKAPHFRKWRLMIRSNVAIVVGNLAMLITRQADYLFLGIFVGTEALGFYYFAYNLTMAVIQLASATVVDTVYFTLNRLAHDPQRQLNAFLRALGMLLYISIPLCVGQFFLAGELVQSIWGNKWMPSVPFIQLLSLGLGARLIAPPAYRFMQAAKKYDTYMRTALLNGFTFVICIGAAAATGSAVNVAIAVSLHAALIGFVCLLVVNGTDWQRFVSCALRLFILPVAISFVVIWFSKMIAFSLTERPAFGMIATILLSVPLYVAVVRLLQAEVFDDVWHQGESLLHRILSRKAKLEF